MVADLEHVDRPEGAARNERGLDGGLGIAGEQRAEAAVTNLDHHRGVVDIAVRQRRAGVLVARIEDRERR